MASTTCNILARLQVTISLINMINHQSSLLLEVEMASSASSSSSDSDSKDSSGTSVTGTAEVVTKGWEPREGTRGICLQLHRTQVLEVEGPSMSRIGPTPTSSHGPTSGSAYNWTSLASSTSLSKSTSNSSGWVSTTQSKVGSTSSNTMGSVSGLLFNNWLHLSRRLYYTKTKLFNHLCSKRFLFFMWILSKTNQLRSQPKALQVWLNTPIANFFNWGHWLPNDSHQCAAKNIVSWVNSTN